ncbi:MAG: hypothetical protein H7Z75_18570 [Ferruginibacter sp.]|nr:hypothetical protein [Cytophagales bacterium]
MNAPPEGQNEDTDDLLLFEYLEGTLPAGRVKALEARLAADAALRAELKRWQATLVTEAFYDTASLEESLRREKPTHPGPAAAFRTLLLVAIMSLFWSVPPAPEKAPAIAAAPTREAYPAGPAAETPAKPPSLASVPENQPVVRRRLRSFPTKPDASSRPRMFSVEKMRPVEKPRLRVTVYPVPARLIPAVKSRRPPNQPVAGKTATRKQRRQVARRKEKALQARKANEFLKGNVPYVVPLNPRSF